jgi:outer membrane biosynthesis protein TonB
MPQPRPTSRTTFVRLVLLALLGWALYAFGRKGEADTYDPDFAGETDAERAELRSSPVPVRTRTRGRRRRFATSLAFATLFFAGAALSAGAGDAIVQAIEDTTTAETMAEEAPPAEESPAEEIPPAADPEAEAAPEPIPPAEEAPAPEAPAPEASAPTPPPAEGAPPATEPPAAETPAPGSAPAPGTAPAPETPVPGDPATGSPASGTPAPTAPIPAGPPVIEPHEHDEDETTHELDPETEAIGTFSTVWLHRALPDPTPPARRLAPAFARTLRAEAARAGVDWAALLGALRADGKGGRFPATKGYLRWFAGQLSQRMGAGEWQAFLALRGRTAYADRAQALTHYNRAVGLRALVVGLDGSKEAIAQRVLADGRLDIYGSGRADIAAGRIDVRVLVLMRYLAEAHGQATISSLQSGHRLYSRPGVISAHIYGLAVDVAAVGGRSIMGNSAPGGVTEDAVRDILLLPAELRPRQVISLLGMGGPSFPMANHADHIHVGF